MRSAIHHLAAGRTESAHVLLKAGDYLFWVRDERVALPEHVRHASFALLFRSLRWLRDQSRSRLYVECTVSITPFLNGERFDLESERVLRVAFEMVCIGLHIGDCDDHVKEAIAKKLITLAKAGERNPDILCEEVLKDIRRPQQWAASEAAQSSVLSDST